MILSILAAAADPTSEPWLRESNPAIWDNAAYYRSGAGEVVTPKSALGLPAYFACIRVLSEDAAKLPVKVMRDVGDNKKEVLRDHPYVRLLNRVPNESATAITLREFLVGQCAGWGNGYWEILRDGNGATGFVPLLAEHMRPQFTASGRLEWEHRDARGVKYYQQDQVIHLCGPSQNGYVGESIAFYGAESLGAGLAQQRYAGSFYANGAVPLVVLEHPGQLKPEARDRLREDWERLHAGAGKAHRTAVLQEAMKPHVLSISPKDAESIETRRFTIEDVCRWFRMPPGKIQHFFQAKGWDSSEAENQHYYTDTLMPWLEKIEAELDRKLFPDGDAYVEHDYSRLLKADAKSRAEYYSKMFSIGGMTRNEIRAGEGMDDSGEDGDVFFVPVNVQPLDRALNPPEPAPAPAPAPADDEEGEDEKPPAKKPRSQLAWIQHTLERGMRKESKVVTRLGEKHAGKPDAFLESVTDFAEVYCTELRAELDPVTREAEKAEKILALLYAYVGEAERMHRDPAKTKESIQARERLVGVWARAIDAIAEE